MLYRRLLMVMLVLALGWGGVIQAQEETASPEPTVETPTEVPTEIATDAPTEAPTDVATEVPTEIPTDVPTDVATETPPEATEIATEEPTAVVTSAPPVVNLDSSAILEATAGIAATFQFTVSDDEAGLVRVGAAEDNTSLAVIEIVYTDPVETTAPFNTGISLSYTAAADFVGVDSLKLKAIDPSGITVYFTLTVNVNPAVEATLEPTVEPTAMPDQVRIINYNPAATEESIQAMLAALGAIEVSRIPQIGAMKVQISQAVSTTQSAIAALSVSAAGLSAGLTSVEPEIIYYLDALPNDPYYPTFTASPGNQWALVGGDGGMYVDNAWGISVKDGTGVTVAVIDSGIDTTHPDLTGKLVAGYDFYNDDANTDDDNGHGTHVAGVIAANTNNGKGIAGIAFNAKLLPVKVCGFDGSCPSYEIAAGLVFAADKGAKVANLSLGGTQTSTTIQGAVQYAISRNVIVVAAAGNCGDGAPGCGAPTDYMYPASYAGVISVAAHDIDGIHASFSTYNDRVTVSAPGVDIISTVPLEYATCTVDIDPPGAGLEDVVLADGYCNFNGTSMAAPQVSGVVALMLSDNVVKTPAAAREALICSAWDAANDGYDNESGYGLVTADFAQNWLENNSVCKVPAPNDLYQNATNIPSVPFTISQAIDSRSVTTSASDPSDANSLAFCDTPEQSLWYKFKPTVSDYYQITTLGSSYDTQVGVWQLPEEGNTSTNFIGCNDESFDFATDPFANPHAAMLNVPLTAGQTYYIMVDSYDLADEEILVLDVRRSMFNNNVDYQENSPNIYYYGTWAQTAATGASGGQVKVTNDLQALAVFTFRGVSLDIVRTVGPTQGDIEVWIDGFPEGYLFNKAAVLKRNQVAHIDLCGCNTPGLWHQVVLRRAASTSIGAIDIDRIRTYEAQELPNASISALTDDSMGGTYPCATKKFCYTNGSFTSQVIPGANMGKVMQTLDVDATISFRATGANITIFRSTGPTYGSMDVWVDGVLVGDDVSNDSPVPRAKVPYVISGLGVYSHVVQIFNNDNGLSLPVLQFDAALASTPTAIAASTTMINENAATLTYSGYWTNLAAPGSLGNTLRQTSDTDASISFKYTGNWFRVGYRTTVAGATVEVYQDNQWIGTITDLGGGGGVPVIWGDTSGIPDLVTSDRTHTVRLVVTSGTFELDAIGARRQVVITPSMGLVAETNAAIAYNNAYGAWTTYTVGSVGGYKFQGGSAKRASADGARLTFYTNGTGFILYTSLNPAASGWEMYVDGSLTPYDFTFQNTIYPFIDLSYGQLAYRFRPIAYAITGLTPGIHKIELRKWDCIVYTLPGGYGPRTCSATDYVDFDGVRVFP
jgi:subtilisin family serine protease